MCGRPSIWCALSCGTDASVLVLQDVVFCSLSESRKKNWRYLESDVCAAHEIIWKLFTANLRSPASLMHILFLPLERRQFRFTVESKLCLISSMAHHVLFQICASQKSGALIPQTLWFWLFGAADSFGVVFCALNKTKELCSTSKSQCYAHQCCGCSVVCLCINKDNTRHL